MTEPFANPGTVGSGIQWADYKGALVLIDVLGLEDGIKTVHGPTAAIRANVVILSDPGKGEEYNDTLIFPKLLQSQLRTRVGSKVLARVGQGTAKPGQSPPWILEDPSDADKKVGIAYLSSNTFADAEPPF